MTTPAHPPVHGRFYRKRVGVSFKQPSLAKQAFKDECDINNIMKRFERDGILNHFNQYGGQYGDFTDAPDYHDAMNKITAANEMFLTLPAAIRARFSNDPGEFLAFVDKPENANALIEMGLARPNPGNPPAPPPAPEPPPPPRAPAPPG